MDEFAACLTVVTFHTELACGPEGAAGAVNPNAGGAAPGGGAGGVVDPFLPKDPNNPVANHGAAGEAGIDGVGKNMEEHVVEEEKHIGGGWMFIFMVFLICGCYIGAGIAYNQHYFKSEGNVKKNTYS